VVRGHWRTESCSKGTDRRAQREAAVTSVLALHCTFTVHGDVLKQVEVFKCLGRLLAQDNDDIQAVRQQSWAGVEGGECGTTRRCKFYKAVVQSVLLYGSKTWNLSQTMLARLEGFHTRAAYGMARKHKPCRGLFGNWIYPLTKDVLEECGLHPVKDYIDTHRSTIAMYVVNRLIFWECQEGERMRGSMPRQWWWEEELALDV
jgi:hypothetical protein